MNVSKVIVAPVLALVMLGTAACGESAPSDEPTSCPRYEVLEASEDGTVECEPDENENGIDDEDEVSEEPAAEEEDSDKKKKPRKRTRRR